MKKYMIVMQVIYMYVADIEGLAEWCDIRTNVTSQRVMNY